MGYNHFTILERENLMLWFSMGLSISQIAKNLARNKSSISREIKRNSKDNNYIACEAQQNYLSNRKNSKKHKILENKALKDFIADKFFNHQWSSEQIVERTKIKDDFFPHMFYDDI